MGALEGIRTFDLFCGGGGCSLGAKQAGAVPVGGADVWKTATEAFETNLPGSKAYNSDVRELDPRKVRREVGPIDLLLASPECTHHSVAMGIDTAAVKTRTVPARACGLPNPLTTAVFV